MIICLKKCESEVGYGSLRKGMGNVLSQAVFEYIYKLVMSKMTEIVSKTTSNSYFRQKCCYY